MHTLAQCWRTLGACGQAGTVRVLRQSEQIAAMQPVGRRGLGRSERVVVLAFSLRCPSWRLLQGHGDREKLLLVAHEPN